jgi:hypothetical protein
MASLWSKLSGKNPRSVVLVLCQIQYTGPDGNPAYLYLTDNSEAVNWNGNRYDPFQMQYKIPDVAQDADGMGSLVLSGVDQSIIKLIRSENGWPVFKIMAKLYDFGDTSSIVDVHGAVFKLKDVSWQADTVQCKLASGLAIAEMFPRFRGDMRSVPGLK